MKSNSTKKIVKICLIGVMAALVYAVSTFIDIPIPTGLGKTRLHLGNAMCLLSGLILGPVGGGFAAGLGSAFYDLLKPEYITSAPFTFAFKFLMAWLCGIIAHPKKEKAKLNLRYIIGATSGALLYVVLYLSKNFIEDRFVYGHAFELAMAEVVTKGTVSLFNAMTGILVAVPLYLALKPALKRFNI